MNHIHFDLTVSVFRIFINNSVFIFVFTGDCPPKEKPTTSFEIVICNATILGKFWVKFVSKNAIKGDYWGYGGHNIEKNLRVGYYSKIFRKCRKLEIYSKICRMISVSTPKLILVPKAPQKFQEKRLFGQILVLVMLQVCGFKVSRMLPFSKILLTPSNRYLRNRPLPPVSQKTHEISCA